MRRQRLSHWKVNTNFGLQLHTLPSTGRTRAHPHTHAAKSQSPVHTHQRVRNQWSKYIKQQFGIIVCDMKQQVRVEELHWPPRDWESRVERRRGGNATGTVASTHYTMSPFRYNATVAYRKQAAGVSRP